MMIFALNEGHRSFKDVQQIIIAQNQMKSHGNQNISVAPKPLRKSGIHNMKSSFKKSTNVHNSLHPDASGHPHHSQHYLTASDAHHSKNYIKHIASNQEAIYSPFLKNVYIPPHLDSSIINKTIFQSEHPLWKIRPSSSRKYNYDELYQAHQRRYQSLRSCSSAKQLNRSSSKAKSKIKSLIDEDRATYYHFQHKKSKKQSSYQREKHPDDDLSQQSSGTQRH